MHSTACSSNINFSLDELEKNDCNYETSFFVTIRDFRTSHECVTSYESDINDDDRRVFRIFFSVTVYPNGDCKENEGFISVFFSLHRALVRMKINSFSLSTVVSMVDCEENQRYFQSFAENHDLVKEWNNSEEAHYRLGLDRYLMRKTILNSSDLLHGDSLIIKCDVIFSLDPSSKKAAKFRTLYSELEKKEGWIIEEEKVIPRFIKKFHSKKIFERSLNFGNKKSPIVRSLRRRSCYFEKLFETSLDESKKKQLPIREGEYEAFFDMLCYVRFGTLNHIFKDEEYFDLYVVSDKYEVTDLKQRCSEYLKYRMASDTAAEILVISDLCNDRSLKSSVMNYILENKYDVIKSDGWKWLMKERKSLVREVIPIDGEFLPVEGSQIDWFDAKNYLRIKRHLLASDFSAQRSKNSLYSGDGAPLVQSCPTVQREMTPKSVDTLLEKHDLQRYPVDEDINQQEEIKITSDDQTFFENNTDVPTLSFYS